MIGRGSGISQRGKCPYCEHPFEIEAREIRGELRALKCFDCCEAFVVEVNVAVTHRARALADVDEVMDALAGVAPRPAGDDPPPDAAASAAEPSSLDASPDGGQASAAGAAAPSTDASRGRRPGRKHPSYGGGN